MREFGDSAEDLEEHPLGAAVAASQSVVVRQPFREGVRSENAGTLLLPLGWTQVSGLGLPVAIDQV